MLPKYKKILLATDLTANSVHAFKHAVLMARHRDARIHLLHVVPEVDPYFRSFVSTMMGEGNLEKFELKHEDQARAEIKKELEEFTRRELTDFPEDLKRFDEAVVVHGNPAARILQVADELDVDVIVMGTHGKGPLEHTFLGSVAEKVLQKSRRPVFVIPLPG